MVNLDDPHLRHYTALNKLDLKGSLTPQLLRLILHKPHSSLCRKLKHLGSKARFLFSWTFNPKPGTLNFEPQALNLNHPNHRHHRHHHRRK